MGPRKVVRPDPLKDRECPKCKKGALLRLIPTGPPKDIDNWRWDEPRGAFKCEYCKATMWDDLLPEEPRDRELAPRVRA